MDAHPPTLGASPSEYSPGYAIGGALSPWRLGGKLALVPQLELGFSHRNQTLSYLPEGQYGIAEDGSLALDYVDAAVLLRGELMIADKVLFGLGGAYGSVLARSQHDSGGEIIDMRGAIRALDGYEVRYDIPGYGPEVLFWRRADIDLDANLPGYRRKHRPLTKGRLWYPTRITRRSLPDVYEGILEIEHAYAAQADGAIDAMEGFALVVGLGSAKPTLRTTGSGTGAARQAGHSAAQRSTALSPVCFGNSRAAISATT